MLAINPAISSAEDEYPLRFSQEVQDYIELNKSFAPANPSPTLDETRQSYLDFCAFITDNAIFAVQRNEYTIASDNSKIALRCYRPENPRTDAQILFFHGGGFVMGNLDSHDSICAQFAERANMTVTAVDYRLAPENQHPAAYNDCMNAYQHLLNISSTPIILCGDSAGGTLAAAVCNGCIAQNIILPIGQLLIYPYLGGDSSAGSYQRHRNAPLLSLSSIHYFAETYYGKDMHLNDPLAFPLRALQFAGLPATIAFVAEIDPICDDGIFYTQRLRAAGVPAQCNLLVDLPHGCIRAWKQISAVQTCWKQMITALETLAKGDTIP